MTDASQHEIETVPSEPVELTGRVVIKHAPANAETAPEALEHEITPAGRHYVRTNFGMPALDAATHLLAVDGAVHRPTIVSIEALRALPQRSLDVTMECAGNDRLAMSPLPPGELWGGGAVASATWGGPALRDVLGAAGIATGAVEVLVEAADKGTVAGASGETSFARSMPLSRAMHADTILALDMNGAPLPREHGAPVRLVVPGWYGMASVKWVTRISVLTEPFTGWFQSGRYVYDQRAGEDPVPVREMAVKAIITSPADGKHLSRGPVVVHGWAWSGLAPVSQVEVAVDGGDDWRPAKLSSATSPYLWRRWEFNWTGAEPGRHTLRVRAHDAAGRTQPHAPAWNRLGYGANGVRTIVVTVG